VTNVFCLHRVDPANTGDIASAPVLWVPELRDAWHVDVLDGSVERITLLARSRPITVVVGGGGIFGDVGFSVIMEHLANALEETPNLQAVVWGAGSNAHYDSPVAPLPQRLFARCQIVGLRDRRPDYEWAPCASVLHPAFVDAAPPVHAVVAYCHQSQSGLHSVARTLGIPTLTNWGPEVREAIHFIASGSTVVTDTYHGAYWATLLGRRVSVVSAFSTKFEHLPWAIPVSRHLDIHEAIEQATAVPWAYEEARSVTNDVTNRVLAVVTRT
jgi:hypothetical protein